MADAGILAAFVSAALVFGYMPGPALVYATAQTIARGRKAGYMAALGLHAGGYVNVAAATFGLSALFIAVPWLYTAVKFAGAAYLIVLGARLMLRKPADDASASAPGNASLTPRRVFLQSMTVEILNPKSALFFLAFLPQFVDPAGAFPVWLQLFILGTAVNVIFSSADIVYVTFASTIATRLRGSGRGKRIAQVLGGSALVGLGASLALKKA